MKAILAIFLLIPCSLVCQINYENPPWDIQCDSSTTQASMNRCSGDKAAIADSIMYNLLSELHGMLESRIELIRDYPESDYPNEEDFLSTVRKLNESQNKFEEYRSSACEYERSKWAGGSISPLMYNMRYLELTIERIKLLEKEYNFLKSN